MNRGSGLNIFKFLKRGCASAVQQHFFHQSVKQYPVGIIFLVVGTMEPNVRVVYDPKGREPRPASLDSFERISKLLDSKFEIPGTRIRFGLDPLLSLIPVAGDLITLVISSMLIYTMHNHGASRKVVIKMMLNAGLDTVIGAIPLVGTVFDVFFRANERNVRLLREHYFEGKHQGSGKGLLAVIFLIAIVIIAAVIFGIWQLIEAIF